MGHGRRGLRSLGNRLERAGHGAGRSLYGSAYPLADAYHLSHLGLLLGGVAKREQVSFAGSRDGRAPAVYYLPGVIPLRVQRELEPVPELLAHPDYLAVERCAMGFPDMAVPGRQPLMGLDFLLDHPLEPAAGDRLPNLSPRYGSGAVRGSVEHVPYPVRGLRDGLAGI